MAQETRIIHGSTQNIFDLEISNLSRRGIRKTSCKDKTQAVIISRPGSTLRPRGTQLQKILGYGISQKISGTQKFSVFWDMGYPRDIPKKIRYIEIFRFLGYGISQGYPKKNPVHRNFDFFGIWDIPGISQKFAVYRNCQFFWDMGYPRDIPKNVRYIEIFCFWDMEYPRDIL